MESTSKTTASSCWAYARLFATALGIVVGDQLVKRAVVERMVVGIPERLLGDVVRFTRTSNTGAAFGLFRGRSLLFILISAAASVAIVVFSREIARLRRFEQIAFGLVLGGAVGNLIDRVRTGAVVDFIDIGFGSMRWPAFNVADSAITIGVVLLAVNLLFLSRPGRAPVVDRNGRADEQGNS